MKKALFISAETLFQQKESQQPQYPVFAHSVFRCLLYIGKNLDFDLVLLNDSPLLSGRREIILEAFLNEDISFHFIEEIKSGSDIADIIAGYDIKASFLILKQVKPGNKWPENIRTVLTGGDNGQVSATSVVYASDWEKVVETVALDIRKISRQRITNESSITVNINLDGTGTDRISTGIGFFDHLISQLARHSGINLEITAQGDLDVDEHHTIEDTAITLGEAFLAALGSRRGMERYGFALPMDDCMAQVLVDFGGRPWLVWNVSFKREKIGDMPTEMFMHFFKSFSDAAKCNLHITATGTNEHHKIEAIFKAAAKAFRMALKRNAFEYKLPTTKGMI
jgi:imidazoleglycerol-phosphate dehydratase / histidinol-phosphatase